MTGLVQRSALREALDGDTCISPAGVFDPVSARAAEAAGYRLGLLSGSVAAATILAAPDLNVLTLTELADVTRRITRASRLDLLVDADHGYGNALSAWRTAEELEHAGAAGISIEDTDLPAAFGQEEGSDANISIMEMVGKLRAAVQARRNPSFVVAGRTSALRSEGLPSVLSRVRAYGSAGIDAIFVTGLHTLDELSAIHDAARLPIILGSDTPFRDRKDLAACGGRVLLEGNEPFAASVAALHQAYSHLRDGVVVATPAGHDRGRDTIDRLVNGETYRQRVREYLTESLD